MRLAIAARTNGWFRLAPASAVFILPFLYLTLALALVIYDPNSGSFDLSGPPSFASDIMRKVTRYLADNSASSCCGVIPRWEKMCVGEEPGVTPLIPNPQQFFMSKTNFTTNPIALSQLLHAAHQGQLQLPDFQRSWVWDEDRIISLIASVLRGFPVGALMTLKTQAEGANKFAYRLVQGGPDENKKAHPVELLLDGQQRITSLYQTCMRNQVVKTITAKKRVVDRWFYIDIQKALSSDIEREDAILAIPADRRVKSNFDKNIDLDLSSPELEYKHSMFPLARVFDLNHWLQAYWAYWNGMGDQTKVQAFFRFQKEVLDNITGYQIPVISLASDTSHEAVCLVFEKVNTGGKALDAFELLTAMYSAQGHKLRDDWLGNPNGKSVDEKKGLRHRLSEFGRIGGDATGVLSGVSATDFLQSIALLHGRDKRLAAKKREVRENDLPAVRATRQALLDLPLEAYLKYRDQVSGRVRKVNGAISWCRRCARSPET